MNGRYFLDTNIFLYSFDAESPAKKQKSQHLIGLAIQDGNGLIDTQVLQEFLNLALHKFKQSLSFQDSKDYLENVLSTLCEVYGSTVHDNASLAVA